jgi:hypothetical protein
MEIKIHIILLEIEMVYLQHHRDIPLQEGMRPSPRHEGLVMRIGLGVVVYSIKRLEVKMCLEILSDRIRVWIKERVQ